MIDRIVIQNFKTLRQVDLKLGSLNLLIGSNASGKSNFLDALRLVQGVGSGLTFQEILDGRPRTATADIWDPIRGGSARALFAGASPDASLSVAIEGRCDWTPDADRLDGDLRIPSGSLAFAYEYRFSFTPGDGKLQNEQLIWQGDPVYDSEGLSDVSAGPAFKVRYYAGRRGGPPHVEFERSRPVLTQITQGANGKISAAHRAAAKAVARALADMQRIDPSPALLRGYSQAHRILRMGEHGENFAALIQTICDEPSTHQALVSWLKELRPAEVDDVGVLPGAVGEPLFVLKERGREYPAPVLSDGTLRFAAIAAALLQPDMPALLTIEEMENGVHASRLRLLVELLRSRANEGGTQVLATTHSPLVLAWLTPEEYASTFFCKRDPVSGESDIRPLTEIPRFKEIVNRQPISDLFAEGWMEAAL